MIRPDGVFRQPERYRYRYKGAASGSVVAAVEACAKDLVTALVEALAFLASVAFEGFVFFTCFLLATGSEEARDEVPNA